MEPNKNYVLVGVYVLISLIALALFTIWLTNQGKKEDYRIYQIHFTESVNGLAVGGAVKYRGVEVGNVKNIRIDRDDAQKVRVYIRVLADTPIKSDTIATMKIQGITGASYINLEGGTPSFPNLPEGPDGAPPEIKAKVSELGALMNQAPELMDQTLILTQRAQQLLSEKNIETVGTILQRWEHISASFEKAATRLDAIATSTERLTAHMDQATAQIDGNDVRDIMQNLRATSANLKGLSGEAEGGFDDTQDLVGDLRRTARQVRDLSQSLQDNPSRLLYPSTSQGVKLP